MLHISRLVRMTVLSVIANICLAGSVYADTLIGSWDIAMKCNHDRVVRLGNLVFADAGTWGVEYELTLFEHPALRIPEETYDGIGHTAQNVKTRISYESQVVGGLRLIDGKIYRDNRRDNFRRGCQIEGVRTGQPFDVAWAKKSKGDVASIAYYPWEPKGTAYLAGQEQFAEACEEPEPVRGMSFGVADLGDKTLAEVELEVPGDESTPEYLFLYGVRSMYE